MDAPIGSTLWSTATPDGKTAVGPVSVTNEVFFGTSIGMFHGYIYALVEAKSGYILWQHRFRGSIATGILISHNCLFIGEGISVGATSQFDTSKGYGGVCDFAYDRVFV